MGALRAVLFGKTIATPFPLENFLKHLEFSPDQKYLVGFFQEGHVCVWDACSFDCLYQIQANSIDACFAFSFDNELLAILGHKQEQNIIQVWQLATGKLLNTYAMPAQAFCMYHSMAFSRDNKKIYFTLKDDDVAICFLDLKDGEFCIVAYYEKQSHKKRTSSAYSFPAQDLMIVNQYRFKENLEYFLEFWSLKTNKRLYTLKLPRRAYTMRLSSNGTKLLLPPPCFCCPYNVLLWDIQNLKSPFLTSSARSPLPL